MSRSTRPLRRVRGDERVAVAEAIPVLLLVGDTSTRLHERRRADCERLKSCEDAWIEVRWDEQAKCPPRCRGFEPRAPRKD